MCFWACIHRMSILCSLTLWRSLSFAIFGSELSVRVSGCQKLQMTGLTRSGTGCFIAVVLYHMATVGVKGLSLFHSMNVMNLQAPTSCVIEFASTLMADNDTLTRTCNYMTNVLRWSENTLSIDGANTEACDCEYLSSIVRSRVSCFDVHSNVIIVIAFAWLVCVVFSSSRVYCINGWLARHGFCTQFASHGMVFLVSSALLEQITSSLVTVQQFQDKASSRKTCLCFIRNLQKKTNCNPVSSKFGKAKTEKTHILPFFRFFGIIHFLSSQHTGNATHAKQKDVRI